MALELRIMTRGDQVALRTSDGRLDYVLGNCVGLAARSGRRQRVVMSVGLSLEAMRAAAPGSGAGAATADELAGVEVVPALDPARFDPEVAAAFLSYIIFDARSRHGGHLDVVDLSLPGFEAIDVEARSKFILGLWDLPPLRLNGKPRWTPSRRETWRTKLIFGALGVLPLLTLWLWLERLSPTLGAAILGLEGVAIIGYALRVDRRKRRAARE